MAATTRALETAFSTAHYRICLVQRESLVVVDQACPIALAKWLRAQNEQIGWILTAHNPGARRWPAIFNDSRQRRLIAWAKSRGFVWLTTRAVDPSGQWPDEAGLLVAGPSAISVRLLARRLGQLAVVRVALRAPARLVWV